MYGLKPVPFTWLSCWSSLFSRALSETGRQQNLLSSC